MTRATIVKGLQATLNKSLDKAAKEGLSRGPVVASMQVTLLIEIAASLEILAQAEEMR